MILIAFRSAGFRAASVLCRMELCPLLQVHCQGDGDQCQQLQVISTERNQESGVGAVSPHWRVHRPGSAQKGSPQNCQMVGNDMCFPSCVHHKFMCVPSFVCVRCACSCVCEHACCGNSVLRIL